MELKGETVSLILADSVAEKPVYYQNHKGRRISYIEHAAFIAACSGPDPERPGYWRYPMLQLDDCGTHFMVTCLVTRFESKPDLPDYQPFDDQIIQIIRSHMQLKGWSQYTLAQEAGISQTQVSAILGKKASPSIEMLVKIMKAFKLRPVLTVQFIPEGEQDGRTD